MLELYFLLIFMIITAVIAVQLEDLLSSIIALGAVGIALSMAFLVLKAPDLAITQLVVEILCLIVLISATMRKDLPFSASGRWFFNTTVTVIFVMMFLGAAYFSLKTMPVMGSPQMAVSKYYLESGMSRSGAMNIVAAISHYFRAYDLLGAVAVLFTAVIGVLAVVRRTGYKQKR